MVKLLRAGSPAAKDFLKQSLTTEADALLAARGFARSKTSLQYKRSVGDTRQTIDIWMKMPPAGAGGPLTYLAGNLVSAIPAVNKVALEMLHGDAWLLPTGEGTVVSAIGAAGPRGEYQDWAVKDEGSFDAATRAMMQFLSDYGVPFLDAFVTPADLIAGTDKLERTSLNPGGHQIRLAAAYVCEGHPRKAYDMLAAAFQSDRQNMKAYAASLKYVKDLLET